MNSTVNKSEATVSVQQVIQRLNDYWNQHGCAVLPPCSFEVPLAIMHPQAFFRLLDEAPWRVAYLQPISRPADARWGRHPYRTARHLQFHVVVKDPPLDDIRGWYLDSLRHLGLVISQHDLRLDQWRWQSESLDAAGLGWRTRVDGMGVGGLRCLQRAAGRDLPVPSLEVIYGVERLAMVLGGLDSVFSLPWLGPVDNHGDNHSNSAAAALGYDRLHQQEEEELSRYFSAGPDPQFLRRRLEDLHAEAQQCLDMKLVGPAYELAIKALPTIDILHSRAALTRRERQDWLQQIRQLVIAAAELYLAASDEAPHAASQATPETTSAEASAQDDPAASPQGEATASPESAPVVTPEAAEANDG